MRKIPSLAIWLVSALLATHPAWSADGPGDSMPEAAPTAPGNTDMLPEGDGREAVMQSCLNACHQKSILLQAYSAQEWAQCVDDMIALGASISDEDYVPIILYLAKHYSPTADTP